MSDRDAFTGDEHGEFDAAGDYSDDTEDDQGEEIRSLPDDAEQDDEQDSLSFDARSLRYIELCGDDSKVPAQKWGGYSQDFDDADAVFTHGEVVDHDSDAWGVVGCEDIEHGTLSVLVFDIDLYKLPDDFDVSRVELPEGTLITRSQNGGLHVYFKVHAKRGELSEGDFDVGELPIDIRGSAVSHHVVAPSDIPGVAGSYEVETDEPIATVFEAREACERITVDGEPAITVDAGSRVNIDFDRPAEAPDDMPACYHAGLSLRKAAPDNETLNTHKVNVLTGLCGLAAGYSVEDVARHMCGEYAPVDGDTDLSDQEQTEYQVQHLAGMLDNAGYSPPAVSTMRQYGILGEDEDCCGSCGIESHDPRGYKQRQAESTVRAFVGDYDAIDDRPDEPDERSDDPDAWDEWPSKRKRSKVADAVAALSDDDFETLLGVVEARVEPGAERIIEHREIAQALDDVEDTVMSYENELVFVRTNHRWLKTSTLLNFEFDVTSRLSVEDEGRMAAIHVSPSEPNESAFDMQIEPRVFNDARRFSDEVLAERFSTTIESSMHDSDVMDLLRKYVARQDVPDLVGQKQMGLSRDGSEFVTPNGTINADGWVDEPNTIHVEQESGAERMFVADPGENGDVDDDEIATIIELFTGTRDPERLLPIIGWMYAAPFRPRIFDRAGGFNLAHVNGESGAGKTGTLAVAAKMFGMSEEPFSCTDTKFTQIKTMSASRGVPVWLDEYKASEMPDWQVSYLHKLLRGVATGGVEKRGNGDHSEDMFRLRSPAIVSGETEIRGSAEQRRAISVTFKNGATRPGTDEYNRFKELAGDATTDDDGTVTFPDAQYTLANHAVGYYSHVAGVAAAEFEHKWFSAREYVSERLAEWGGDELDEMEVQGLQTVRFGYVMMREFAEFVGADLSKLPGEDDLDEALRYIADIDSEGRVTHQNRFLELAQRAAVADYLEMGAHYTIIRENKDGEELRLNVSRAFDAVSKYVRDHDLSEDLLGSARDYKSRYGDALESDEAGYVTTTSQGTPDVGRCVGIHTQNVIEDIPSFDTDVWRSDFDATIDTDAIDDDASDDDDDGDDLRKRATPLNAVTASMTYPTITAEVVEFVDTPEEVSEAGGPVASGSLIDETGRLDVVVFDDARPDGLGKVVEGATLNLKHVDVDEYDRSTQVVLDRGTEIIEIAQGVGYTEGETPLAGQAQINDAAEGETTTDGGERQSTDYEGSDEEKTQNERVDEVRQAVCDVNGDDAAPVTDVKAACEFDDGQVASILKSLKHKGEAYTPVSGALRLTNPPAEVNAGESE